MLCYNFLCCSVCACCVQIPFIFFGKEVEGNSENKNPHPFRQRKKARPNQTEHNSASKTLVHAPNSHISTPSRLLYMSEPLWHKHHELWFTQSHKKTIHKNPIQNPIMHPTSQRTSAEHHAIHIPPLPPPLQYLHTHTLHLLRPWLRISARRSYQSFGGVAQQGKEREEERSD